MSPFIQVNKEKTVRSANVNNTTKKTANTSFNANNETLSIVFTEKESTGRKDSLNKRYSHVQSRYNMPIKGELKLQTDKSTFNIILPDLELEKLKSPYNDNTKGVDKLQLGHSARKSISASKKSDNGLIINTVNSATDKKLSRKSSPIFVTPTKTKPPLNISPAETGIKSNMNCSIKKTVTVAANQTPRSLIKTWK
jgi:hypothetical protein